MPGKDGAWVGDHAVHVNDLHDILASHAALLEALEELALVYDDFNEPLQDGVPAVYEDASGINDARSRALAAIAQARGQS
jgi:hypothetical protein